MPEGSASRGEPPQTKPAAWLVLFKALIHRELRAKCTWLLNSYLHEVHLLGMAGVLPFSFLHLTALACALQAQQSYSFCFKAVLWMSRHRAFCQSEASS